MSQRVKNVFDYTRAGNGGCKCSGIHDYEKGLSHHFVILFLLHHYVPSDIGYHVSKKQNQVPSTNIKTNVKNIVVKMKEPRTALDPLLISYYHNK